jgi:hypothetical protein
MAPALLWFGLSAMGLILMMYQKEDTHSIGSSLFGTFLVYLLYFWGGVFESFQWADVVLIMMSGASLGYVFAKDGETYQRGFLNRASICVLSVINAVVLYYAGFFDSFFAAAS